MTERPLHAVKPIRVAHVVEDFSLNNSGITSALEQLAANTERVGVLNEVYHATRGEVQSRLTVHGARPGRRMGTRRELLRQLWLDTPRFDVIHVHGVWDASPVFGLGIGRVLDCPVVFTPHNMIGGWLWHRSWSKWLKKSAYLLVFGRLFGGASVIHALSPVEAEALKDFFPKTRIAVVPNGIELSGISGSDSLPGNNFLYLGRLYEGKGLELLIDGFGKVADQVGSRLLLAGTASVPGYESGLRQRAKAAGVADRVDFLGRVDGEAKWQLLRNARAVFLPSYSEGISMVALETFAAQTPLVATRTAGCPEVGEHGGLIVELTADSIAESMLQVASWTDAERLCRGAEMRELAEQRYSWDVVGEQYLALYRSVVQERS